MATPFPFQSPITSAGHNSRHDQIEALVAQAIAAGFTGATTTLTAQALSGQPDLVVASVDDYLVGDSVYIGFSGSGLVEPAVIDSINALTITLTENLSFTHPIGTPVSRSPAEVVAARGTAATLKERLEELELGWTNAARQGLNADGVADDHGALQAASDLAGADGLLFIPPGTYATTDTLVIQGAVEATGVTLIYSGTGTALRVRNGSGATKLERKRLNLPLVEKSSPTALSGRVDTLVGVELVNVNACEVYVPWARNFGVGLLSTAFGQGTAYNTIHLGHLDNNKQNLKLHSGDAVGWVNENLFLGGRLSMDGGEGTNIAGARHVLLTSGAANNRSPNNNVFLRTSVEGNGPEYHMECYGSHDYFMWLRWEADIPKVKFSAVDASLFSNSNVIFHGYKAESIVVTEDAHSKYNQLFNRNGARIVTSGSDIGGMVVENSSGSSRPAFAVMPSGDGLDADSATRWVWRMSQSFLDGKTPTDTGARFRLASASGVMSWGPGDGTFDTVMDRSATNRLRVRDDLLVKEGLLSIFVKAGPLADTDAVSSATDGNLGVDSTNGRLYFRYGGAWHYAAATAGFQIPRDERECPNCGKRMRKGQRVIGRLNATMKDGALHGLYEHLECPGASAA